MDLVDVIKSLNEGKTGERGSYRSRTKSKSLKGTVKVYRSIMQALRKTKPGAVWSTEGSGRRYVTTKQKWGKSKQQTTGGKTAKGFTPGSEHTTPGASKEDVEGVSKRLRKKYGTGSGSDVETKKDNKK